MFDSNINSWILPVIVLKYVDSVNSHSTKSVESDSGRKEACMARQKNQHLRRSELVHATQSVLAQFGLDGTRLHRVAKQAGVSPGTVLYYYPDMQALIAEAIRLGIDRFDVARRELVESIPSPAARLESLIRHGLPLDGEDLDVRVFNQLGGAAGENSFAAVLLTSLYDRQVELYRLVLEQGATSGDFSLAQDPLTLSRNLVALEDAYGYRIVARHGAIDAQIAANLILDYAQLATGYPFADAHVGRRSAIVENS
jgi:AcrR family transcriptional regulator